MLQRYYAVGETSGIIQLKSLQVFEVSTIAIGLYYNNNNVVQFQGQDPDVRSQSGVFYALNVLSLISMTLSGTMSIGIF